jgi:putative hemolysin
VIGTYRLQTGATAARHHGYYSAQEFDFTPYEPLRDRMLELGRACVHRDHRSFEVLTLLWKGVARYAMESGSRYLIGCSSLTSQDPREASAMYHRLSEYLVEPELRTVPVGRYWFRLEDADGKPKPPKLLRTYLAVGAKICGPPAIDREFKTIDFLTLMDLEQLPQGMRARLFR